MTDVVVGRDSELTSVRDFVAGISDGAAALVLQGEAGVGKTTLWTAAVGETERSGLRVLRALPAESETTLSFAGVGDLLEPVLEEALAALPAGQRRALSRALVLEEAEGPPPDAHAVGVGLLNALRSLAAAHPLVVAVDDVQWLDTASSGALGYAARRLRDEHIGLLLSRRAPLESPLLAELRRSLPPGRYREIEVGPLSVLALHRVVQAHLGVVLPRPLLAEVHDASGGNPFYALEVVRTLQREGVSVEAGQPLPLPESLHDLVHGRLLALSSESRDYLLAAAAHAHPRTTVVEAASGVSRAAGLVPSLDAGVVEVDGERIRFTHPLLAAGAYETADPARRIEIHARLAELLEDPEARAWQLAASAHEPDESVAAVLEDAARHARARGAPRPAALLLDRAHELTPPGSRDEALRRAVDAAYLHYESGDSPRAEAQLRDVIAALAPGRGRARAMVRLARVRTFRALREAAELFLQAIADCEGDRELLAVAHEGVATCFWQLYERLDEAVEHADRAIELALEIGDEALAGEALNSRGMAELLLGRDAAATMEQALVYQPAAEQHRVLAQPRWFPEYLQWAGALEESRDELRVMLRRASELGDESSPPYLLASLSRVQCELGELGSALETAALARDAAEQAGQQGILAYSMANESLVEARRGRDAEARAAATRALELVGETGDRQAELVATWALGQLELVVGAAGEVVSLCEPFVSWARTEAIAEPSAIPFVVDHVEALVELGRTDEAIELLDWYEGNARRLERIPAVASCARCRGLLAAQTGALDDALAAYEEGLQWHAKVDFPLDRGRTLLALGAAQRRTKRRREARETLEEALALFERIGAVLWAERARAELKRISGRAATPGALTPAEERVAALVAEGKTNREVAAALYLSDRTVEGHLSRIFGKLGIKHRSEVAAALASRQAQGSQTQGSQTQGSQTQGSQTQGIASSNTGDSPVSADSVAP